MNTNELTMEELDAWEKQILSRRPSDKFTLKLIAAARRGLEAPLVSREEANELCDVLRTLVPTGRAFLTSARELRLSWDKRGEAISQLQKQVGELRKDKERLDAALLRARLCISSWSATIQKYESWKANNADPRDYPDEIVNDYHRLRKSTEIFEKAIDAARKDEKK